MTDCMLFLITLLCFAILYCVFLGLEAIITRLDKLVQQKAIDKNEKP